MGSSPLSSRELVERLWNDVRLREEVASKSVIPELPPYEQSVQSEALQYLNVHFPGRPPHPQQPGTGPRLKRWVRARLARFVVGLFGEYLEAEREFNTQVVHFANSTANIQNRLVHDVRRLAEAVRTESLRLTDEFDTLHRLLESRIAALEDQRPPQAT